ncbi:MAG: hypothetical protein GC149_20010 [Gammaproteobacteria bacterium]|nr:hypothetical protein [Gammaproteobacteria bacterium]
MSVNTEYFVIESTNNNNYPLLEWDDDEDLEIPLAHSARDGIPLPVPLPHPIKLVLGEPIPRKPQMVDFHELPEPVVGKKIKDVLEPLSIDGIQLLPAVVTTDFGVFDYWYLHVYNEIECMDRDRSISTYSNLGDASDIKKLVLAEHELDSIPLDMRLIFVLKESTPTYLFHQSIVDKILAVKPEGVRFFRVDQWSHGSAFV